MARGKRPTRKRSTKCPFDKIRYYCNVFYSLTTSFISGIFFSKSINCFFDQVTLVSQENDSRESFGWVKGVAPFECGPFGTSGDHFLIIWELSRVRRAIRRYRWARAGPTAGPSSSPTTFRSSAAPTPADASGPWPAPGASSPGSFSLRQDPSKVKEVEWNWAASRQGAGKVSAFEGSGGGSVKKKKFRPLNNVFNFQDRFLSFHTLQ